MRRHDSDAQIPKTSLSSPAARIIGRYQAAQGQGAHQGITKVGVEQEHVQPGYNTVSCNFVWVCACAYDRLMVQQYPEDPIQDDGRYVCYGVIAPLMHMHYTLSKSTTSLRETAVRLSGCHLVYRLVNAQCEHLIPGVTGFVLVLRTLGCKHRLVGPKMLPDRDLRALRWCGGCKCLDAHIPPSIL